MEFAEKEAFLEHELVAYLRELDPYTAPSWGKMSAQQMVEHFADAVRLAAARIQVQDIISSPEHLEKLRAFIISDKPFRENTVNPLMPQAPAPVRHQSYQNAVDELAVEVRVFFHVFREGGLSVSRNPIFGDLNYEQNVHLLHKHALHHLRQFGLTLPAQTA